MWQEHWRERGFDSWKSWRANCIAPLGPERREWFLYHLGDLSEVSEFFGVPSRGWIDKCYEGEFTRRLKDITDKEIVKDNPKVISIKENFPLATMLTGVIADEKLILVEGMHRSLALTLAVAEDKLPVADVSIALATVGEGELSALGKGGK